MNWHELNPQQCYHILEAKDARYDGVFFVGVRSTGVYCRPVCRVRTPKAVNCRFFPSAASAEQGGFRPCLRCRPELAPGLSRNEAVQRLAHRAAEQIRAGALNDHTLVQLAASFQVSDRQLRRAVEQEFGVSPIALAQTHRLLLAKQLLTDSSLKVIDIAFASGFSSLRRFNDAFRKHYHLRPSDIRQHKPDTTNESILLRLGYRPPLAWPQLVQFLSSRSYPGLVHCDGDTFSTSLRLEGTVGWFSARHDASRHCIAVTISQPLLPRLSQVIAALRHLFDLNAHPAAIDAKLKRDALLAPLLQRTPGLRIPGTLDGFELALRAILGQQVSVKAATTLFGRFVERFGEPVATPLPGLNRSAPVATAIAGAPLQTVIDLGLPERRARTLHTLAQAVAAQAISLDPLTAGPDTLDQLRAIPGIGPWTCQYIAMRLLGNPDALPAADLGLAKALGLDSSRQVEARTESWRPWRAYGAMHLWQAHSGG